MKVEIVQLRRRGHKIPTEELVGPITGCLVITNWTLAEPGGEPPRLVREASLRRAYLINEPGLISPLQDCAVTKVTEHGMLIVGLQRAEPSGEMHRQAWWAKPV